MNKAAVWTKAQSLVLFDVVGLLLFYRKVLQETMMQEWRSWLSRTGMTQNMDMTAMAKIFL